MFHLAATLLLLVDPCLMLFLAGLAPYCLTSLIAMRAAVVQFADCWALMLSKMLQAMSQAAVSWAAFYP